jgi:polysaccharide biosynthesis protein PslH
MGISLGLEPRFAIHRLALMKILLLASRVPYPLHNGEDLRVFHFAKYLSRRHELHLLAYGSGLAPAPEAACYFSRIHTVETPPANGSNHQLMARFMHVFSPDHMYFFDPQVSSELSHLLKQERFDLVWIPAWQMIPYAREIREVPVFIDVMDDGILELARELRWSRSLTKAAVNLKRLFVTYLFERRYFRRATLCSLVSERDAEILSLVCPGARHAVIPNGVDGDYFRPLGLDEDFPSLIFEGNMSFSPSIDAVLYFCREILPLIWKTMPQARCYIVGKDPVQEIRALASDRITVTGYVDDVRPYLDRATVFVCPMRKGAGIKNKILQAWAMAKPVVATSTAVAGLYANNEGNILIADEPGSFARQVDRLLNSSDLRRRFGQNARGTVLRHHTWQQQVKLLEDRLAEL